jgi:methionyl-tRNA synthetase
MNKSLSSFVVTLPPPTPNGGLHVGHLTGPFLGADAFAKAAKLQGHPCFTTCYSDVNQSYVRVTAKRQKRDPNELSAFWTDDIVKTLTTYNVGVSDYFPVEAESQSFVRQLFQDLYARSILVKKPFPIFRSLDSGEYLDEAGVSGYCPRCLAGCKCGICESCSGLTSPLDLVQPSITLTGSSNLEVAMVDVMVLELERFREQIKEVYAANRHFRPRFLWVVEDALSKALPDFPVSLPGSWGIPVDHVDFPGQVINAWPEIMAQQIYSYKRAIAMDATLGENPAFVNFYGFDNSYFYAIVHAALMTQIDDGRWLPSAAVNNEFYNLDHAKFSTSNNHVVWAGDLAKRFGIDEVRFYAAFNSPGFEKANFNEKDMAMVVEDRLHSVWDDIVLAYNAYPGVELAASLSGSEQARAVGQAALRRIFESYSLERFHLRQATEDLLHLLELISVQLRNQGAGMTLGDIGYLLKCFALAAYPLMPVGADTLYRCLTGKQISAIGVDDALHWHHLPAGLFRAVAGALAQPAAVDLTEACA